MVKLIRDSAAVTETQCQPHSPSVSWRSATNIGVVEIVNQIAATLTDWNDVPGLEPQQRQHLHRIQAKGVLWNLPGDKSNSLLDRSFVFRLSHGGEVLADGNCLFTASQRAMNLRDVDARQLRKRAVKRFLDDFLSVSPEQEKGINDVIRNMYSPDLKSGWGVHVVQEVKLLARKLDRKYHDSEIDDLVLLGMQRDVAAESVYKERCIHVKDIMSWAKYMSISGSSDDEHDIITLQYTEDGLLSVDENRDGRIAAFGDDIAIECLATEFKRVIYVVQAHGDDAMVDEDNCVFFLPHHPRNDVCELPFFLFMKGTGWCGAGGDHYEPLIAHASLVSNEKVAMVL